MAFLVDSLTTDADSFKNQLEAYYQYLASVKDRLPPDAYSFATASWHYDFSDHRSPHDSWVESITVREPSAGDRQQHRQIEITVLLLAAYHDGHIALTYKDVRNYKLSSDSAPLRNGHGDWLIDEVRLSESGLAIHEVEFASGARWLIECADLQYQWKPALENSHPRKV
jgi:hypothetical protein